jgi:hypothetical protein
MEVVEIVRLIRLISKDFRRFELELEALAIQRAEKLSN